MAESKRHSLEVPGATLVYDIRTPSKEPNARPLFILGSPMAASGFAQLADLFDDRLVLTYDPRGCERSSLNPGGEVDCDVHADDYHRVVKAAGLGPIDVFASSGGAVNALAWISANPDDMRTVVAHEPPLWALLDDRDLARRAAAEIVETYGRFGFGRAMAKFIKLVVHRGPIDDSYFEGPDPDPSTFGFPTEDDGSRDDLLLGRNMATMPFFEPDLEMLRTTKVRIIPAIGTDSDGTMAHRGAVALAEALGIDAKVFPGDHGGFARSDWSPNNDPVSFHATLRQTLSH